MSRTLDGKFRIHARLSNTSYMHLHSWTSASLRRLYIGQFLTLHFKDREEDSAKNQRIYYIITKYFHAPWNYQMTLLVSWFLFWFGLFWFGTNLWPFLTKSTGKALIYSYDKNNLFSYDIIRGIQQATSISFFFFFGESTRESKENTFCTLW